MPDDKGVFELPGSAGDPDLGETYGVSIRWDEDGHVTPVVTIPGGDLPSESLPQPILSGTTPFDIDHDPLDRAIWNANHPPTGVQLPYDPTNPLHLPRPFLEDTIDDPTNLEPGDYPEPGGDPALAVNDDGTTDSQDGDVFG